MWPWGFIASNPIYTVHLAMIAADAASDIHAAGRMCAALRQMLKSKPKNLDPALFPGDNIAGR
jgi:hypothetical protein